MNLKRRRFITARKLRRFITARKHTTKTEVSD